MVSRLKMCGKQEDTRPPCDGILWQLLCLRIARCPASPLAVAPLLRSSVAAGVSTPVGCRRHPLSGEIAVIETAAPLMVQVLAVEVMLVPVVMEVSADGARPPLSGTHYGLQAPVRCGGRKAVWKTVSVALPGGAPQQPPQTPIWFIPPREITPGNVGASTTAGAPNPLSIT